MDADQSDACSEKSGAEAAVIPACGVVTEQMIEEENKLRQQAELEAQRKKEERDQVRSISD